MIYDWDEAKRLANIEKHGLDFCDAKLVYESKHRLDIPVIISGERRIMAFAYVFDFLAVATLVVARRGKVVRCISYRRAHKDEREVYYEWLANNFKD